MRHNGRASSRREPCVASFPSSSVRSQRSCLRPAARLRRLQARERDRRCRNEPRGDARRLLSGRSLRHRFLRAESRQGQLRRLRRRVCGWRGLRSDGLRDVVPDRSEEVRSGVFDTQSDAKHCGGCNAACPAPLNGTAGCAGGACKAQCNSGYRLCGASCVAESPTACGATCKVCPSNQGTCAIKCNAGYQPCATGCCLIAPVCKPDGASCTTRAECCNDICFASRCLCMSPGQSCESDKQCCNGKKCGFYDGSPNECIP